MKLKSLVNYIRNLSTIFSIKTSRILRSNLNSIKILNLGCGPIFSQRNVISLDYNDIPEKIGIRKMAKLDVNFDLSKDLALPFTNNRFKAIYTSHCMEHLTFNQVKHIFRESYRILDVDGIFRIVVPSIDLYFDKYDEKDLSFFNWIRNKSIYRHDSWLRFIVREFAGPVVDDYEDDELVENYKKQGREKFIQTLNQLSNNCIDEYKNIPDIHKSAWTFNSMRELLLESGFSLVKKSQRYKRVNSKLSAKSQFMIILDLK